MFNSKVLFFFIVSSVFTTVDIAKAEIPPCNCICAEGETPGEFDVATAYFSDCGVPSGCEGDPALTAEVACYKCGTKLDCVIDTTDQATYVAIKAVMTDPATDFCNEEKGGQFGKKTKCGQQCAGQTSILVAPMGTPVDCPIVGPNTSCPSTGQDLSNFGTYQITVGGTCPGCSAEASCVADADPSLDGIQCVVTEQCQQADSTIQCIDAKCDSGVCPCQIDACADCGGPTRKLSDTPHFLRA